MEAEFFPDSSATIKNNVIIENRAIFGNGGGICGDFATIQNNVISKNSSTGYFGGGGIYCSSKSYTKTIQNNVITENSAPYGGGIFFYSFSSTIINNTISRNSATFYGGGIACHYSSPTVRNTILWANSPKEISLSYSSITITYSDILGGWEGEGNIDGEPSFVDPDKGDYRFSSASCCIGAGKMTPEVPVTDIEGNPRPNPEGSKPDIGAYENPLDSQLSYYGAIYGTVVNPWTKLEIGEAKVSANPGSHVTYTDKNGYYIFDNLPVGTYAVTASAIGYHPEAESDVEVITCKTSHVDFELIPIIISPANGNWLELDGVDDFAFADDSSSLDVGDEGEDLTIEAWVYPRRFPSADSSAIILSKPGAYKLSLITTDKPGFEFTVYDGEGVSNFIGSESTSYKNAT